MVTEINKFYIHINVVYKFITKITFMRFLCHFALNNCVCKIILVFRYAENQELLDKNKIRFEEMEKTLQQTQRELQARLT